MKTIAIAFKERYSRAIIIQTFWCSLTEITDDLLWCDIIQTVAERVKTALYLYYETFLGYKKKEQGMNSWYTNDIVLDPEREVWLYTAEAFFQLDSSYKLSTFRFNFFVAWLARIKFSVNFDNNFFLILLWEKDQHLQWHIMVAYYVPIFRII